MHRTTFAGKLILKEKAYMTACNFN